MKCPTFFLSVLSMTMCAIFLIDHAAAANDPDAMVVKVNGDVIREKQVAEQVSKHLEIQAQQMPEGMEINDTMRNIVRTNVVEMLVEQTLLDQTLDSKSISVTDRQVMGEIEKLAVQQNMTMEQVPAELARSGMTMDDLKEQVRLKVKMDKLIEEEMPDADVSNEDIEKFYKENPEYFEQPEQVRASHILIGVGEQTTQKERDAARERIAGLLEQIKDGADFAALAAAHSDCPSSERGGDLGMFGRGQMVPQFEQVVFALEEGRISPVVETDFGYHIIKKTGQIDAQKTPLSAVREQIGQHLVQQKRSQFWGTYSRKIREKATIEYSESEQKLRQEVERIQQQMQQMQQQR